MKLEISYKNSVIGSLSEGESIALHLNGQKLTEDLVVRAVNVNLISFTIDGTTYQAEEGMTWEEWVESEYNTGGYTKSVIVIVAPNGWHIEGEYVSSEIISGKAYKTVYGGGGGPND